MKIKSIIIYLTSLVILVYLPYYLDNFQSVEGLIILIFILFPIFAYGVLFIAKDINTRIEQKKEKSFFYHFHSFFKIIIGIIGILLGILMGYLDLTTNNIDNWFNALLHILIIYALLSIGAKIFINTVKIYRNSEV